LNRSQQPDLTDFDPNGSLSQRLSHLDEIAKNSPDIFFVYDRHTTRFIYCNSRVIDLLGYSRDEFQSMRMDVPSVFIHPEDQPAFQIYLEQIFKSASGNLTEFMGRCRQKSGQWLWMKIAMSVFDLDENENPVRLMGRATDVSAEVAAKESLLRRVQLLELIIDSMSEGVIVCDTNGDLLVVNQSARQMLKIDSTSSSLSQIHAAYDNHHDSESIAPFWHHHPLLRALAGEKVQDQDLSLFDRRHNLSLTLNHAAAPLVDKRGQIIGAIDVFRDSTEKHRTFYELKRTEEQFRLLVEGTTDYAIFMLDHDGLVVSWNPGAERILGFGKSEVIGQHLSVFFTSEDQAKGEPERKLRQASQQGRAEEDGWRVRRDDHRFWCTGVTGALRDTDGKLKGFVVILRDNTERRLADQNNFFLANHDALTGLPNRARFLERLHEALINADRDRTRVAVLLLDLDRFKAINDTLGHHTGDQFLKLVSKRLTQCVRETDTVARLGGDEFVLILTRLKSLSAAELIAENVIHELSKPYTIDNHEINSGASVGIAFYPQDGRDSGELLQKADLAMYRAKATGRGRYRVFAPGMLTEVQQRRQQEEQLRSAIARGEFDLVYQPQIDLETLQITGVEALLRCRNSQLMVLSTGQIISLAEEMGLICSVGAWVLDSACSQLAHWRFLAASETSKIPELSELRVSVNIAPAQLLADTFIDSLKRTLDQYGLPATTLEIEITEACLVSAITSESHVIDELKSLGVSVSIDDFGAGMSSLSYLKQFPVDVLKLEPGLISNLPRDQEDAAIVSAIIRLASDLHIKVVAEGVENFDQLGFLRSTPCHRVQGFLFSEAVRPDKFIQLLQNRKSGGRIIH
jgi:diguanylate cyclase (GGDEF)-like protein/PAS domain S-box-containing protein